MVKWRREVGGRVWSRSERGFSGRWELDAKVEEALEIVGKGNQSPFLGDFLDSAHGEAAEAEGFFDDSEDGFDGLLA